MEFRDAESVTHEPIIFEWDKCLVCSLLDIELFFLLSQPKQSCAKMVRHAACANSSIIIIPFSLTELPHSFSYILVPRGGCSEEEKRAEKILDNQINRSQRQ